MADKITSYGRVGIDTGQVRARSVASREGEDKTAETRRSRAAADAVELTGTATRLKSVESRLAEVPDVDQARVREIRQRIESGEYRPDPARIAARLLRMEQDLA
ncbi:MAG: hypothetical protein AMXMBFR8_10780 [Nevskiales bacterium]